MLIYGNTPGDIVKMASRNKTKILLLVGAVVLAVSLGTNRAEADETDKKKLTVMEQFFDSLGSGNVSSMDDGTVNPGNDKNLLDTVKAVPTKVASHISNEVQETKEYQAKSWAEAKAQWLALKTKFLSK